MPIGPYFPGTFENYVASVIHDWQQERDDNLEKLAEAIESLGLTWKVRASRLDDARLEVKVGRLPHAKQGGASDLVSIADVGFGVSQVLPVLVALLVARKGQMVFVEQPELHLHPRAQHLLSRVLADAAKRGVRVIAETHSHLLILGIQSLIAEGKVPPDLVRLHWFQRDPQTGETRVTPGTLDRDGAFGNWPEDFSDVSLRAHDQYLSAAEARQSGGAR
jgi:predicted ATPase